MVSRGILRYSATSSADIRGRKSVLMPESIANYRYNAGMPRPVSTRVEILQWESSIRHASEQLYESDADWGTRPNFIRAKVKAKTHSGWIITVNYLVIGIDLTLVGVDIEVENISELLSRADALSPYTNNHYSQPRPEGLDNSLLSAWRSSAVTATGLRSIPLSAIENVCKKRFARENKESIKTNQLFGLRVREPESLSESDLLYLMTAAKYVEVLAKGTSRPLEGLATMLERTPSSVRNLLYMARQSGFLTESPPGKAGGHLTNKAKEYLRGTRPEAVNYR